jgi:histidyl-tRNA synthetase
LDTQSKLDKQLKFADRKQIPWVAIVGPDELTREAVVLKNLKSGTQEEIKIIDLPHKIR